MDRRGLGALGMGLLLAVAACGGGRSAGDDAVVALPNGPATPASIGTTTTLATTTTATLPPATTTTAAPTSSTPTTAPSTAPPRSVPDQGWGVPFAAADGLQLLHPSSRVERIGFHESAHDGARPMEALASAVSPVVMESRERGTAATTAADIVVQPDAQVRAPVSGTVVRAGGYTLYCDWSDEYVVIAPDGQPTWELKLLHIVGVQVRKGQRVTAGETVVARHARQLAFESQVDELRTTDPAWPHVHVELVDPSVPDRPSPGGGC